MPTARELLEQAEALMRRERAGLMGDGIPTLTDSVPTPGGQLDPELDARRIPSALDDIPLLTESVEDLDTPSIPLAQSLDAELALWRETPHVSPQPTPIEMPPLDGVQAESVVPTVETAQSHSAEPSETIVEMQPAEPPAQAPSIELETPTVDESERWNALAEDIRMQVLQRIDIFTDTGLKDQLNQRLQPIVDRASADLVAAINQHVGQLLRAYVAEAIEREIEKWRANSR